MKKPDTIDAYIAEYPEKVQAVLQQVRQAIKEAAPKAGEKISYGLPTFTHYGNLVHFGAFKSHLGFYAFPTGNVAFAEELSKFKTGKGSAQFPFDTEMPLELIKKITAFRVKENEMLAAMKKK
ncbi:MAG TPA: DUF1801 domain-containing protein [Flavobacterium sp.]|jgi:uncharacterized protein YdhG (YjbR/CyaY superfamily)